MIKWVTLMFSKYHSSTQFSFKFSPTLFEKYTTLVSADGVIIIIDNIVIIKGIKRNAKYTKCSLCLVMEDGPHVQLMVVMIRVLMNIRKILKAMRMILMCG